MLNNNKHRNSAQRHSGGDVDGNVTQCVRLTTCATFSAGPRLEDAPVMRACRVGLVSFQAQFFFFWFCFGGAWSMECVQHQPERVSSVVDAYNFSGVVIPIATRGGRFSFAARPTGILHVFLLCCLQICNLVQGCCVCA